MEGKYIRVLCTMQIDAFNFLISNLKELDSEIKSYEKFITQDN